MPTTAEKQLVKRAQDALKAGQGVHVALRGTPDSDGRASAIAFVDEGHLVEITWLDTKLMRFLARPADILGIAITGEPKPVDDEDED